MGINGIINFSATKIKYRKSPILLHFSVIQHYYGIIAKLINSKKMAKKF